MHFSYNAHEARMIKVKARTNESLDQLLKRFKKACEKEGLIRDMKRTAFYEKPSEIRRRKERQLVRRILKESRPL
jgi:small subunit ribosomal protein S21